MTTAASNALSKASISRRVARLTSDPFSSFLYHLHQGRWRGRGRERMQRQLDGLPRIRTLMDVQAGQRPQRPQVGVLPNMLIRIMGVLVLCER